MILWLVERTNEIGWDEYDSLVVAAETIDDAIAFSEHLTCHQPAEGLRITRIGIADDSVEAGTVHSSFCAG